MIVIRKNILINIAFLSMFIPTTFYLILYQLTKPRCLCPAPHCGFRPNLLHHHDMSAGAGCAEELRSLTYIVTSAT